MKIYIVDGGMKDQPGMACGSAGVRGWQRPGSAPVEGRVM